MAQDLRGPVIFNTLVVINCQRFIGDLMNEDQIYEDHHNMQALREAMKECLEHYNDIPSNISMDLVLFNFAVENGRQFFFHSFLDL